METGNSMRIRELTEKMSSDPDLSTVNLDVLTCLGYEPVVLEFPNAEKRSVWEATLKDAKINLIKHQTTSPILQNPKFNNQAARPGLQLCTATLVPGKRADSFPLVWVCASDKFSGQVSVLNIEGGEVVVESFSAIGNAAITAMCTVPPTQKFRKRKLKSQRSCEKERIIDMRSSGSEYDSSSDEQSSSGGQTTVWIGNDDGEVFVVNSTERIRSRARERLARLRNSVTSICAANGNVYVATYYSTQIQLLMFKTLADGTWDLENPISISHCCTQPISAMIDVGKRIVLASGNALYGLYTDLTGWQKSSEIIPLTDSICVLTLAGGQLYLASKKSTIIHVVDVFTLRSTNHFNIAPFVRSQLAGKEDILREHKMGCLRITTLTIARSHLWIGTSAGYILSTSLNAAKTQPSPDLNVCEAAHCGPCRIVIPITSNSHNTLKKQKMSTMTTPSHQNSNLLILSCGEGNEERKPSQDNDVSDSLNTFILWKCT
ncbi:unnamed protein product [Caenorhabditis angaria]|uniref:Uncharacterized protein n=1 Tax=Caenorhabditis angaria TaxID=860376 RepID=A0A9P1N041_9PELO|nr:unnamed protein product [Caenorhabditis angaria]